MGAVYRGSLPGPRGGAVPSPGRPATMPTFQRTSEVSMMRIVVSVLVVGLAALTPRAAAQACPFNVQFTSYGSACSPSGCPPSAVGGLYTNGPSGCSVTLTVMPGSDLPTTYFISSFLLLGFQSASAPVPNGCTLLAFPTLFFSLPFTNALTLPIPPDPALAGATAYSQGIVYRQDVFGTTNFFDLTPGTQISIL